MSNQRLEREHLRVVHRASPVEEQEVDRARVIHNFQRVLSHLASERNIHVESREPAQRFLRYANDEIISGLLIEGTGGELVRSENFTDEDGANHVAIIVGSGFGKDMRVVGDIKSAWYSTGQAARAVVEAVDIVEYLMAEGADFIDAKTFHDSGVANKLGATTPVMAFGLRGTNFPTEAEMRPNLRTL